MIVHFEKTERGIVLELPDEFVLNPIFADGDVVEVMQENGRFIVARPGEPRYTIEELLEGMTAEHLHEEISTGPPRGNEVW